MTSREHEIRTENRSVLHKLGKKRCNRCEVLYDNIPENFDVMRLLKNGSHLYTGSCKQCSAQLREERNLVRKTSIEKYVPRLLGSIKSRAKEQNLPYDLDAQWLIDQWHLQQGLCYYTQKPMNLMARTQQKTNAHRDMPSVDKLIPALGYAKGNVVWCTFEANRFKSDCTEEELYQLCERILECRRDKLSTLE